MGDGPPPLSDPPGSSLLPGTGARGGIPGPCREAPIPRPPPPHSPLKAGRRFSTNEATPSRKSWEERSLP